MGKKSKKGSRIPTKKGKGAPTGTAKTATDAKNMVAVGAADAPAVPVVSAAVALAPAVVLASASDTSKIESIPGMAVGQNKENANNAGTTTVIEEEQVEAVVGGLPVAKPTVTAAVVDVAVAVDIPAIVTEEGTVVEEQVAPVMTPSNAGITPAPDHGVESLVRNLSRDDVDTEDLDLLVDALTMTATKNKDEAVADVPAVVEGPEVLKMEPVLAKVAQNQGPVVVAAAEPAEMASAAKEPEPPTPAVEMISKSTKPSTTTASKQSRAGYNVSPEILIDDPSMSGTNSPVNNNTSPTSVEENIWNKNIRDVVDGQPAVLNVTPAKAARSEGTAPVFDKPDPEDVSAESKQECSCVVM